MMFMCHGLRIRHNGKLDLFFIFCKIPFALYKQACIIASVSKEAGITQTNMKTTTKTTSYEIIEAIENPDKSEVCNWSTEATYGVLCSNGDGEDLITIEVQIGSWNDSYFIRTTDDAGGGDDCDDTLYADIDEAIAAAKEWAENHDETPNKNDLAEEIAKDGWWDCEMTAEEILEIAVAAEGHRSGSRLWISNKGNTHWDTGNTIRVEGWADYITISASHDSVQAALMSMQFAINVPVED